MGGIYFLKILMPLKISFTEVKIIWEKQGYVPDTCKLPNNFIFNILLVKIYYDLFNLTYGQSLFEIFEEEGKESLTGLMGLS